jgi:hypothetical protein
MVVQLYFTQQTLLVNIGPIQNYFVHYVPIRTPVLSFTKKCCLALLFRHAFQTVASTYDKDTHSGCTHAYSFYIQAVENCVIVVREIVECLVKHGDYTVVVFRY